MMMVKELKEIRKGLINDWMVGENRFREAINWDVFKEILNVYESFNDKWLLKAIQKVLKTISENCQSVTWKHVKAMYELSETIEIM